jgi:hypothetical protein
MRALSLSLSATLCHVRLAGLVMGRADGLTGTSPVLTNAGASIPSGPGGSLCRRPAARPPNADRGLCQASPCGRSATMTIRL